MKLLEWQISVSLVCAVLGALLAIQIRTQSAIHNIVPTRRVEEMAMMLKDLEDEKKALIKENADLKDKLEDAARGRNLFKSISEEIRNIKVKAGFAAVKGPGIVIRLDDSAVKPEPGEDPNLFLIHEEDLLKISNELFAAGAEAVSINDQRMIATTGIDCAGTTILVNNKKLVPPYVIKAIGDEKILESSLLMRGKILETLKSWSIRVRVTKSAEVLVPPYRGTVAGKFAAPVPAKEDIK